jgi:phospholipase/carboxylesterase
VSRIAVSPFVVLALALLGCDRRPEEPAAAKAEVKATPSASAGPGVEEAGGVRFLTYYVGGAKAGEKLPTIVGLHGRGDRPDNYATILRPLKAKARLVVGFGVIPTDEKGYQWFEVAHTAGRPASSFEPGAAEVAPKIVAMLIDLPKRLPIKGKPILTGFSQGAVLAHVVGALHPELISLAAPVAGLLPPALMPTAAPDAGALPRIVAFHGDADSVIPLGWDQTSVDGEKRAGFNAELRVFPKIDHAFGTEEEADYLNLLDDQLRRLDAERD